MLFGNGLLVQEMLIFYFKHIGMKYNKTLLGHFFKFWNNEKAVSPVAQCKRFLHAHQANPIPVGFRFSEQAVISMGSSGHKLFHTPRLIEQLLIEDLWGGSKA